MIVTADDLEAPLKSARGFAPSQRLAGRHRCACSRLRHSRRFSHRVQRSAGFGQTVVQTGPAAATNPFRFSTKYLDRDTGLYCYGFRFYSPTLGRWLNRDPLGDFASLLSALDQAKTGEEKKRFINESFKPLYLFVGDNPECFVDADGRMSPILIGAVYEVAVHFFSFQYGLNTYPGADPHSKCIRHCNTSCIITKWNLLVPTTAITGSLFELAEWALRGFHNDTGWHDIYNNLRGYGSAWYVFSSCSEPCKKKCACEPDHY